MERPTPRPTATRTLAPQGHPPGIYASKFHWPLAARIAERIGNGESLRAICRMDASMPTEKTVWNWRKAHPDFDELMEIAQAFARARSLAAQEARDEARRVAKAEVRQARGFRPFPTWPNGYSEDLADAICERIAVNEPLTHICRDPAMPCVGTVYNWLRRYLAFVAQYRRAKSFGRELLVDRARDMMGAEIGLRRGRKMLRAIDREIARLSPKRYG
ncbi:hypothetical protein LRS10_09860 [Phenylobacterium sp. J426]|uniref:terminase small subunit-like protein n=1 Tax=Phenylobacterium sp. J426 TaxID=2898439 RepID=UPI0021506E9A|nr:hypothetical protein [Phenylobacterium sp. J426]MCR5874446.1 hypothetical protein [Phenylobacterium sp. J426]